MGCVGGGGGGMSMFFYPWSGCFRPGYGGMRLSSVYDKSETEIPCTYFRAVDFTAKYPNIKHKSCSYFHHMYNFIYKQSCHSDKTYVSTLANSNQLDS